MKHVASWLRAWADWLDPVVEAPPVDVPAADPLDVRALAMCQVADETMTDAGGEYKRRWVYAKLLKEFPQRHRSHVGLAIEQAVAIIKGDA